MDDPQETEFPVFRTGSSYMRGEIWRCESGRLTVEHGPWREIPAGGHRVTEIILDEARYLDALTEGQKVELDQHIFGVGYVKITDTGFVRVDPREVGLDDPAS